MENTAKFMALFAGLDRAYGVYNVEGPAEANGKRLGVRFTKAEPVTAELWEKHLSGKSGLGIVPITDDCTAVFGAIDIDSYQDFDVASVSAKVEKLELPLVVCRSKSGGAHIYLFAGVPVPASVMRARLQEMASILGHGTSEIFPKQDRILAERGDIGGWINMPYFGGIRGMRYAVKPNGDALEPDEFLEFARTRLQPRSFFDTPVTRGSSESWIPDGPPCLQQLVEIGVSQGGRNEAMIAFGIYLKKAFPDEWKARMESYNQKFFNPPLDHDEVKGLVRSLERGKDYNYPCQKPPIMFHCNAMLCRSRVHGIGGAGAAGQFPVLGELRKLMTQPPIWFWDVNSKALELTTEELQNPRAFQAKCMAALNMMPALPSQTVWQSFVQQAMLNVVPIEVPNDSSTEGQFWELVEKFCTGRSQAQSREEILHNKVWTEDGMTWFRVPDLERFLERNHFKEYKRHKLTSILKSRDAQHAFWTLKGKGTNVWGIEEFHKPDSKFDVPKSVSEDSSPF